MVLEDKRLKALWQRSEGRKSHVLAGMTKLIAELRATRKLGVICHARALRRRATEYSSRLAEAGRQEAKPACAQVPRQMPSEGLIEKLIAARRLQLEVTPDKVEKALALQQHGEGRGEWLRQRSMGRVTASMLAAALGLSDLCSSHRKALGELGHPLPPRAAKNCAHGLAHEPDAIAALKAVFASGKLDRLTRCDGRGRHLVWRDAVWTHPGMLLKQKYDYVSASPDGLVTLPSSHRAIVECVWGAWGDPPSRCGQSLTTPAPSQSEVPSAVEA